MRTKSLIYTLLIILTILIVIIFIIQKNKLNSKVGLKKIIKDKYPNISLLHVLFKKDTVLRNLRNDYNIKFLPETQFLNLNLDKEKSYLVKNLMINIKILLGNITHFT